jgi:hypothetical protein
VLPVRGGRKRAGRLFDEEDVGAVEEGSCCNDVEEFDSEVWPSMEVVGQR